MNDFREPQVGTDQSDVLSAKWMTEHSDNDSVFRLRVSMAKSMISSQINKE